jgi:hypothetical protein
LRAELDADILTGLILDRLGNQILFAPWINEISGQNIQADGPWQIAPIRNAGWG